MGFVTLVVMEPGSTWPGTIGLSDNVVVGSDDQGLLGSTRKRLDSLHRQHHQVRVAVIACSDATDRGALERRSEVAHELLAAVARVTFGRLVLSSTDGVSIDVRRELLSLAGTLSCSPYGTLATVSLRFGTATDGHEGIYPAGRRPRGQVSPGSLDLSPSERS